MAPRTYSIVKATDTVLVTTAETVVATLPGVSTDRPGQTVRLTGSAQVTTGAGTTALALRVHRGGLGDPTVGETNPVQIEAAAGSTEDHEHYAEDVLSGEVADQTYTLTVALTGATGNGAVLRASLIADIS